MSLDPRRADPARTFFARTVRGLEEIAAAEIRERLDAREVAIGHRLVGFESAARAAELTALRSVDDVFLRCAERAGVDHTRAALAELAAWAGALDLTPAVGWIAGVREVRPERGLELVASFIGARNFTRFELEEAVGGALARRAGVRLVPMREPGRVPPDLSCRLHLDHGSALLGVRVAAAPLHRRAYKLDSVPGSLHPPVAHALCRLAGGGRLLDPFCGAGTIAIESGAPALALDLSPAAVHATTRNAARAGAAVHAIRGDAAALPLAGGSVDRVVTNPPWRNQVGYAGSLAAGRERLWRELARVLAGGGRIVTLGAAEADTRAVEAAGLTRSTAARLSLGGTWTDVSVITTLPPRGGGQPARAGEGDE